MRYSFIKIKVFALVVLASIFSNITKANAQEPVIRIAQLQIEPTQLESYKIALKEEIETSVRLEPGVLSLYAVANKSNPSSITIFEMYANEAAYNLHRETIHFKKYKNVTKEMVKSLELINAVPIALEAKKNIKLN